MKNLTDEEVREILLELYKDGVTDGRKALGEMDALPYIAIEYAAMRLGCTPDPLSAHKVAIFLSNDLEKIRKKKNEYK